VAAAMRSGRVEEQEKATLVAELLKYQNVILTPHNAFNTAEAWSARCGSACRRFFIF